MKLIRHYDEVPEFVRGMDINVHIFLEAICIKSIDVYYDVIDDGSSIISTVTTYEEEMIIKSCAIVYCEKVL